MVGFLGGGGFILAGEEGLDAEDKLHNVPNAKRNILNGWPAPQAPRGAWSMRLPGWGGLLHLVAGAIRAE